MRYIFAENISGKILNVEKFSPFITISLPIRLDGVMWIVKGISIDIANNKTHIYVETTK